MTGDPDLVEAAREFDQVLLLWSLGLTPLERLRACTQATSTLERLHQASCDASTTRTLTSCPSSRRPTWTGSSRCCRPMTPWSATRRGVVSSRARSRSAVTVELVVPEVTSSLMIKTDPDAGARPRPQI